MALSAGAVVAQFDGDFSGLNKGIKQAENNINGFVSGINNASKNIGKAFTDIGKSLEKVGKNISLKVTAPLTGAMGLVSAQAINQVKQVQNASAGLRAYEKDAGKVTATLQDLVKFAQSDTGVLFQRQDLFDAASTLKMYGNETGTLVDKVKILSKGVAMGKTTFQELATIIGRVGASGKLTATDFDMLIDRGIGLDKSMRGTSITSERLFEALDKALPAELLEGRANTIEGQMIRLQSAFRNVGLIILGTNEDANGFMPGSIGERIFQATDKLRQFIRSAEFLDMVKRISDRVVEGFDAIEKVARKVYDAFKRLSPGQKDFIADAILLTAVLGPVLVILGTFIGVIGKAIAILGTLSLVVGKIISIFTFLAGIFKVVGAAILFFTTPVGLIIAIGGVLIGIGIAIARNWDKVAGIFRGAGQAAQLLWRALSVIKMPPSLQRVIDGFKSLGNIPGIGGILRRIPGFADGVRNFSGGLAVVGERGPELVNLPKGADVFTNEESRRMTAGGGGITIETMNIKSGVDWELGASYMAQKLRLS
jgi:hypothetical protein